MEIYGENQYVIYPIAVFVLYDSIPWTLQLLEVQSIYLEHEKLRTKRNTMNS